MRFSNVLISACAVSVCSGAAVVLEERAVCDVVDPVYSILKKPLQAVATSLCSSYLGLPRTTSTTVTGPASTVTETSTPPPSTTTELTTETNVASSTSTSTITDTPAPITKTVTVTASTKTVYTKRDVVERRALPTALTKFAASKVSSACSCIVTPTTKTNTITVPNTSTATVTSTAPATTVTVTSTIYVAVTSTVVVTTHVMGTPTTTTVTETYTPILNKPKICGARGLPGANAFNYDANFNTNQADCIASCKTDARCLSTGFYIVTDPGSGTMTGTCRKYDKSVTDSADLGFGYYNFNDKAC